MTKQTDWNKVAYLRNIIKNRQTRIVKDKHGNKKGGTILNDETIKPYVEELEALEAKMAKDKEQMTTNERIDDAAEDVKANNDANTDRIVQEISPMVALFSGGDSTNPQDRINARLLQNAANIKANKADRGLIQEQKAIAKAKAKGKAKGKAKASQENEKVQNEEMHVDEEFMHQHKIQIEELPEEQQTQKKKTEEDSSDSDATTTTPPSESTSSESLESSSTWVDHTALINELIDMV